MNWLKLGGEEVPQSAQIVYWGETLFHPVNAQIDMNFRWGFPQGSQVKWLKIISLLFGIWKVRKHTFPMK